MKIVYSIIAHISLLVATSNGLSIATSRSPRDADLPCNVNTATTCPAGSPVINGIVSCCPAGYYLETNDFGQCVCSSAPSTTGAGNSNIVYDETERRRRDTDLPCTTGTTCPADSPVINGVVSCCSSGYYPETNDLGICVCSIASVSSRPTGTATATAGYDEIERRDADLPCTTGSACPAGSPIVNGVASCCSTGYYQDINDLGQCICSSAQLATSTTTTPVVVVNDSPCLTGASCPAGSPVVYGETSCCTSGTYMDISDMGQCVCSTSTSEIDE